MFIILFYYYTAFDLVLHIMFGLYAIHRLSGAKMATIHTSIFTNSKDWSIRVPPNLAALTTLFEPPTGCSNKWTIRPVDGGTVRSGWDDFSERGVPTDYYARCSPYNLTTAQYSPGMCSSGQAVLNITEARFKSSTLWWGTCCDRLPFPYLKTIEFRQCLHLLPGT